VEQDFGFARQYPLRGGAAGELGELGDFERRMVENGYVGPHERRSASYPRHEVLQELVRTSKLKMG
jgi:hypothetical protein